VARSGLENEFEDDPAAVTEIWEASEEHPDDWWLGQDREFDPAEMTAMMLKRRRATPTCSGR
jgi:hypothetical protein